MQIHTAFLPFVRFLPRCALAVRLGSVGFVVALLAGPALTTPHAIAEPLGLVSASATQEATPTTIVPTPFAYALPTEIPPTSTASPTSTPSPTPTASTTPLESPAPQEDDPILSYPGSPPLPAPSLTTLRSGGIEVVLPQIIPSLPTEVYDRAVQRLLQAGFSQRQALLALRKIKVLYIISIRSRNTSSITTKAFSSGSLKSASSALQKIRTRKTRISLRLRPGSYLLSYRAEFYVTKPKLVVIGSSSESHTTRAVVR